MKIVNVFIGFRYVNLPQGEKVQPTSLCRGDHSVIRCRTCISSVFQLPDTRVNAGPSVAGHLDRATEDLPIGDERWNLGGSGGMGTIMRFLLCCILRTPSVRTDGVPYGLRS
jgi:hypothetical protein